MNEFKKLVGVVAALRDPNQGCPWDLKQTHQSLIKYFLEEVYEFIYAAEKEDFSHMEEELGDVLLQILLHARIAQESDKFDLESISQKLSEKLIRRHPHVFAQKEGIQSAEDVETNWEAIKREEKKAKPHSSSLVPNEDLHFPSLTSAFKIGERTQKIGFDWDDLNQVAYKVEEEWQELKEEVVSLNQERMEEELGDLLFSAAQLARHARIDPELALRKANKKFVRRFRSMEKLIKEQGLDITQMNQTEMDVYWDQAKLNEKENDSTQA